MKIRLFLFSLLLTARLGAHPFSSSATISYSTTQPAAGAVSISNWTGATFDAANIGGSGVNADGGANNGVTNDASTYVANNQPVQGQTFTTGANANGYDLSSITVRIAGYTSNTATGTNRPSWDLNLTNGPIIVTVGKVSGTTWTTLSHQNFTSGSTGNPGSGTSANGPGTYLTLNLPFPVHLDPNMTYGFNLAIGNGASNYFEWLGVRTNPYAGGTAFTRSGTTITPLVGDRVFQANLTASAAPYAPFVHPGALHTAADLTRMAAKVAASAQPWKADYDILTASPWGLGWPAYDVDYIVRGSSGNNYTRSQQDAQAIYELALRWKITGDTAYATKAVQIANVWSGLLGLQGDTNRSLAAGICGYLFASGGEILSTYSGWPAAEKQAFKDMMMRVFYPENFDLLWRQHDTFWREGGNTHYRLNWLTANMASMAAIGILCDNKAVYQQAVDFFKFGPNNGRIERAAWYVHPGGLGQGEEAGRDQGHNMGGWYAMSLLCQMAWNQGDDLFGYDNNRVLRVFEYNAKYNLGNDVPYTRHQTCDLGYTEGSVSGAVRGIDQYFQYELVYNHYANVKGLAAPWSKLAVDATRPEPRPNPSSHPSQVDWFGLGSLTFARDAIATDKVPTGLRAHWSKGKIILDWWGAARATSYLVKRGTAAAGPFTQIGSVTGADMNFTDPNVANGTAYYYVVTAVTPSGNLDSTALKVNRALVTQYSFENNANDIVGTRHATLRGGTAAPGFTTGFSGQAVSLSGANQYVQLPIGSGNYQDITLATWVYWTGGNAYQRVFDFGTEIEKTMYLTTKNGGGNVEFGITTTHGGNVEGDASFYLRGSALATNQWVHVAVSLNGDVGTLYVNGKPAATKVIDLVDPLFGQPFCYLGRSMFNSDPYFQGRLDDFRIYNYGLTGNEVYALWAQGGSNSAPAFTSDSITKAAASEDAAYTGQTLAGSATDANGGTLTYTKTTGPTWLSVASNGALTGTPAQANLGANVFGVRVTDASGATDDAALTITVINTNDAPTWSSGTLTLPEVTRGQPYTGLTLASSASDGDPADALSFTKISGPAWLSVATNGTLSGTPAVSDVGVNTFTVRATDLAGAFTNTTLKITVLPFMLRSQYAFDANVNDSVSALHGTATGSPAFAPGRFAQGLTFDGVDDVVRLPEGVASSQDITIAAFVYWNGGAAWQRIFDFGDDTTRYMTLSPQSAAGKLHFGITTAGSAAEQPLDAPAALATGRWVHVAVTLSGNTGTLYVDGTAVATNTAMTNNPGDFRPSVNYLGDSQFAADPSFSGNLDDFRTYNYALTAAEVFDLANPIPEVPSGLDATGLQGKVTLTWTPAQAAQTYTVRRSLNPGGPYSTITPSGLTTPTFTDSGLTNGVTYYYVVSATNAKGTSADSVEVAGTPSDLLVHLKFDETSGAIAADSSGNGWTGALEGATAFATGKLGNAVSFGGVSADRIALSTGIVSALNDFTISAWVKVNAFGTFARVFDFGTGISKYMFLTPQYTATSPNAAKPRFAIRTESIAEQQLTSSIAMTAGAWNHIVITLNGSVGTMYLNGDAVATNNAMTLKPSSLGPTTQNWFADSQFIADPSFNGLVDDFRIYSRALNQSEVTVFQTLLTAPQNLVATPGPKQIALTWNAVPNASSYLVRSATTSGGPYTPVQAVTNPAFTHTSLPQTPRYFIITPQNLTGPGPDSAEVGATPESAAFTDAEMRGGSLAFTGDGTTLTMTMKASVPGHSYQLQFTDDLLGGEWEDIGSAQTGNGNDLTFNVPTPSDALQGYLRFVIQR